MWLFPASAAPGAVANRDRRATVRRHRHLRCGRRAESARFANDRIFDDAVGTNADAALNNDSAFKNAIDVNFDVLRADEFAADVDALGINESDARIKKRIGLGALPRTLELRELALRVDAFDFVDVLRVHGRDARTRTAARPITSVR